LYERHFDLQIELTDAQRSVARLNFDAAAIGPKKGPGLLRGLKGTSALVKVRYLPEPPALLAPPLVRPSAAAGELAPAAFMLPVELALLPFSEPTVRGATEDPVVGLSTATPVLVVPGV
jgi:hypothetical protein